MKIQNKLIKKKLKMSIMKMKLIKTMKKLMRI